jgi:hypothetical protein
MRQTLRDLFLFFGRDLRIASTYRGPFILEAIEALFAAAMFYYVARFVDSPGLREALPHGNTYFAYSLVGFLFFDYLNAALDTLSLCMSLGERCYSAFRFGPRTGFPSPLC